jgi:hypothetical protein
VTDDAPRAGAEAAKLFAAAQDWLRASAPHLAPVAPDGETCACPVCRGIVRVRETDPDSVARWVDGAVAAVEHVLGQAAAGVAQATGGTPGQPADAAPAETDEQPGGDDPSRAGHDDARTRTVRRIPIVDEASSSGSTTDTGPATHLSGG